uniref:Uncharacterized protein n=1 Tax=Anguilla anguilla TaxID=7936 RepID=A0A0E9UMM5_ANGAN
MQLVYRLYELTNSSFS